MTKKVDREERERLVIDSASHARRTHALTD